MEINISELADYYANTNLFFADIFEGKVPPGMIVHTGPAFRLDYERIK